MIDLVPALGTAFLTGLFGSAHCIGMCSGISGLIAVQAVAASLHARLAHAVSYNAGRILSYAILGLIVATLGSGVTATAPQLAGPVRLIGGFVIVLIGLQIAFEWRYLRPIEQLGSVLWARIAPAAKGLLPVTTAPRALGLGLVWGWLPCGLVYSVLLLAATSGRPIDGALVMLAFGAGTAPAMVATGLGTAKLSRSMQRRGTRLGFGLLIVGLGLMTLAVPLRDLLAPGPHH